MDGGGGGGGDAVSYLYEASSRLNASMLFVSGDHRHQNASRLVEETTTTTKGTTNFSRLWALGDGGESVYGGETLVTAVAAAAMNECIRIDALNERRIENLMRASNLLLMIYPWVMMCSGTLTNSISFAVLTRPKLKKSSTFFYLACLCVIDLLSLYTFCINFIFFYHFQVLLNIYFFNFFLNLFNTSKKLLKHSNFFSTHCDKKRSIYN